MTAPLILAVPSKGRLEENARAFFARAGLELTRGRGARDYRGQIEGVEGAEVAFLSAAEIAAELAQGSVHLGVTGEDLVRETIPDADARVEIVTGLGFGFANVVVAVPRGWIDVRVMDDLDDVAHDFRARHGQRLRVATKYVNLARQFFADAGLADYRIVESLGATEGAPTAGSAEIIVDITTTGATLAANDLRVLDDGVILRSEASLVAGIAADWSGTARAALAHVLDLVAAETRARAVHELRAAVPRGSDAGAIVAGESGVTIACNDAGQIVLHVPRPALYRVARKLRDAGAAHVSAVTPDYVFEADNPLLARLLARLEG